LEPSQVAGFNQAFRSLIPESLSGSTAGARFETFGLAFEQKLNTGTYLGVEAELLNSDVNNVIGAVNFSAPLAGAPTYSLSGTRQSLDYQEKNFLVTVNQLLGDDWSLGARYSLSRAELGASFPDIPASLTAAASTSNEATLHQLSLFALFNHPGGFFARAEGDWYSQSDGGYQPALPGGDFWQFNLFAGYRFFQRRAELGVGLLNLTDRNYQLNPLNLYTDLPRTRTFTVSFRFNF
jgi:hypothetical protein